MSTDVAAAPWVPDLSAFGARLALVRHRMGWNQKEAALACGLSQSSWRDWELTGRAPRNFPTIVGAISARTGVDDYWLMTGRTHEAPRQGGRGAQVLPHLDSNQEPAD